MRLEWLSDDELFELVHRKGKYTKDKKAREAWVQSFLSHITRVMRMPV